MSGFLRADAPPTPPPPMEPGETWSYDEADARAHAFLAVIAGGRELPEVIDDPVEHARANGLMLLFSTEVQDVFETYLARMPEPRAEAWRELIAGGASSEAFGPLTLQEQLDEQQVETALQAGRRQRTINVVLAVVAAVVLIGGGVLVQATLLSEDSRTEGALRFDELDEDPVEAATVGGPPVAEPALTAVLTTPVAVAAGDGPREERIVTAPFASLPFPPGALAASLFQFAGAGHVVVVGPEGFTDTACLRASVVTADLRPLDTVSRGPCAVPVGRTPTVGCVGPTAMMLDLVVPAGEVELPEGGSGFADAVRVQVIGDDPDYEVLTVRGTIEVDPAAEVSVPRFGGQPGDEISFDLGDGHVGTCALTGALPGIG